MEEDNYLVALKDMKELGIYKCEDIPFRNKIYKGLGPKVLKTIEEYADGRAKGSKLLSLSELCKDNGVPISMWSLAVLYPDINDALAVAERARAEVLNEKSLGQLFDDDIIDNYGRNDEGNITAPGVALLKARSDALAKQASVANKGKFGKEPNIAINIQTDVLDEVKSIEDLTEISMIDLQTPGRRDRNL